MKESDFTLIRPIMSKEEFLEKIIVSLQKHNLKEDAIDYIDPSQLSLRYLYGYQFKGNADCSYSYQIASDVEVTINDKKTNIKSGTPIAGKLDNCSFNIAVPCVNSASCSWVESLMKNTPYVVFDNTIMISNSNTIEEEIIGEYTNDPLDFWVKNSNNLLDNLFYEPAYALASNSVLVYEHLGIIDTDTAAHMISMGSSSKIAVKNLNVRTRNNLQEYGQKVLIPCYVLEFKYKEDDCFIAAYVCDKNIPYTLRIPEDDSNKLTPEEQVKEEMPEKIKTLKVVNWCWLVALLALFINGLTAAVVCLIIWGVAKWYFKRDINARIKEIEKKRAEAVDNIKSKLYKRFNIKFVK